MASSSTSESHDEEFVLVQEANANDSETTLIRGVSASQTVRELKEAIASEIESEWDEISVAFARTLLLDSRALSSDGVQHPNSCR
jgi:hypothetical protein